MPYELLQRGENCSDKNCIMLETVTNNIILDCQIETQYGWVAGIEFFHEIKSKKAHMSKELKRKHINDELEHPLKDITQATTKDNGSSVH